MINNISEMALKNWEKMFSSSMEYIVKSDTFLSYMGKMLESSSIFKMVIDKSIEKTLESMRMPTRKDIEDTLLAIRQVEKAVLDTQEQMDRLGAKLDTMAQLLAAQARIELAKAEVATQNESLKPEARTRKTTNARKENN